MKLWLSLMAVFCCASAMAAPAPKRAAVPSQGPNLWVGLGGGAYTAEDYEDDPQSQEDNQHVKVGGFETHFTFNVDGPQFGGRFRWSHMLSFTNNAADEMAAEAKLRVSPDRKFWLALGVSRLTDVSNTRKAPTVGFPLEVMYYPVRGLELSIHGNINEDKSYIGFGVAGALGRWR